MKYVCDVCGWEYDEEKGYPEGGIAPGTKWEDVPEDFECPLCFVGKDQLCPPPTSALPSAPARPLPGKSPTARLPPTACASW